MIIFKDLFQPVGRRKLKGRKISFKKESVLCAVFLVYFCISVAGSENVDPSGSSEKVETERPIVISTNFAALKNNTFRIHKKLAKKVEKDDDIATNEITPSANEASLQAKSHTVSDQYDAGTGRASPDVSAATVRLEDEMIPDQIAAPSEVQYVNYVSPPQALARQLKSLRGFNRKEQKPRLPKNFQKFEVKDGVSSSSGGSSQNKSNKSVAGTTAKSSSASSTTVKPSGNKSSPTRKSSISETYLREVVHSSVKPPKPTATPAAGVKYPSSGLREIKPSGGSPTDKGKGNSAYNTVLESAKTGTTGTSAPSTPFPFGSRTLKTEYNGQLPTAAPLTISRFTAENSMNSNVVNNWQPALPFYQKQLKLKMQKTPGPVYPGKENNSEQNVSRKSDRVSKQEKTQAAQSKEGTKDEPLTSASRISDFTKYDTQGHYDYQPNPEQSSMPAKSREGLSQEQRSSRHSAESRRGGSQNSFLGSFDTQDMPKELEYSSGFKGARPPPTVVPVLRPMPPGYNSQPEIHQHQPQHSPPRGPSPLRGPPPPGFQGFQHRPGPGGFPDGFRNSPPPRFSGLQNLDIGSPPSTAADFNKLSSPSTKSREHQRSNSQQSHHSHHHSSHQQHQATPFSLSAIEQAHMMNGFGDFGGFHGSNIPAPQSRPTSEPLVRIKEENSLDGGFGFNDFPPLQDAFPPNEGFNPFSDSGGEQNGGPNGRHFGSFPQIPDSFPKIPGPEADDFNIPNMKDGSFEMPGNEGPDHADDNDRPHSGEISEHGKNRGHATSAQSSKESLDVPRGTSGERESDSPHFGRSSREQSDHPIEEDEPKIENQSHQEHDPEESPRDFSPNGHSDEGGSSGPHNSPFPGSSREETDNHPPPTSSQQMHQLPGVSVENMRPPFTTKRPFFPTRAPFNGGSTFRGSTERERLSTTTKPGFRGNFNQGKKTGHKFNSFNTDKPQHAESSERFPGFGGFSIEQKGIGAQRPSHNEKPHLQQNTPSGFNGFQEFGKPFFKAAEDGPGGPNGFNDNFKPSLMFSPPSDMPRFPSSRPSNRPTLLNGDFDDIDGPFSNEQSEDGPDVLGINDIEGLNDDYKESSGDSSRPSSGQSQKPRGGVANFLGPGFIRGGGFGPFGNPLAGKPPPGPPPSVNPPSAGPSLFGKPLQTPSFANPPSRPPLSLRPSLFGKPLQAPPFASSPMGPAFSGGPGIFGKPPQGPSSFGASPFPGGAGIFGKPPQGSTSDSPFSPGPGIFGKPFPAPPFGGPTFGSPPSSAPLAVGQGIFGKPLQAPPFGGSPIMKPVSGSFAAPLPGPFNAPLGSPAPSGGFLKNIIGGSGSLFKNPLGSTGSVSGFTSPFKSSFPETSPIKGFMSSPAGPPPAFPVGGSFGPGPGGPSFNNPPQTLVGPLINALGSKGLTGALMNTVINAFPSLVFGNNGLRGSLRPSAHPPPPPSGTLSGSAGSIQPTAGNQQGRPITSQTVPLRSNALPGTRPDVQHDPNTGDHHDQDVSGSDEHALVQHQHRPQLSPGGFAGFSHWFSELFNGFTVKTHSKVQASPSPYNEIAHGTKPLTPFYNSHKPQHIKLRHPVKKVKLPLKKILTPILDFAHKVLSFYAQFSIDKDHYIRVISFAGVYLFFAWLFKDSAEHALLPRCEPWGWGGPEEHSFHAPARFLPAPPVDPHLQQEFFHLFRGIENCLDEKVEKDKKKKKKKKDKKKKKKDDDKHKKKHHVGNGNGNGNDNDNDRGRGFSDDSEEDDDGGSGSVEQMEADYAYELKYINDMCPRGQFFYSMSPIQREAIDALAAVFVAQPSPGHVLHVARSLLQGRSVHPKVWYYALIAAQGQRPDMLGLQIPHPLDAMPDNFIPAHLIEYEFKRYRGLLRPKRSLLPGPTGNGTSELIIDEKGGSSNVIFVNSSSIFTAPSHNLSANNTNSKGIVLEKGFLPGLNGTSFKQSKSRKDGDSENESDEEEDDEIDEDDYDDDRKGNRKKHPLGYGFGFIGDGYGNYKRRPPVKFGGIGPNGENHNGFFAPHGQVSNPYGRPIDHVLPPSFSDGKQKGKKKDKKKKKKKKNKKDKCIIVDGSVGLDNGIENKLWYWREDMMMNQHHWYWHQNYPVNASRHGDRAAELFFYMHRQFIARYDAERLSNGFARTVPLPLVPGAIIEEKYDPHIKDFHSGKYWTPRPPHVPIQDVIHVHDPDVGRNILMQEIVDLQSKFLAAIKWGGLVSAEGLFLPIRFHNGIMPLVNTVEATNLSVNPLYYNTFGLHNLGHLVVGFAYDNDWSKQLPPGPMADVTQSMKDPAFFSYHLTLDDMLDKFKQSLPPYKPYGGVWPLEWHGVDIVDVTLDTHGIRPNNHLTTFFIKHKFQLEPGVDRSIAKGIAKANVCAVHMDHAPFQYKITVDMKKCASSKTGQGTIRIFMAPRYNEHGERLSLLEQRRTVFQLDAFQADLKVGRNVITRNAKDSALTRPWTRSLKDYMKRPDYSGVAEPCGCGWPQHLLIPKGNTKGMAFDIFVMVTNYDEDHVDNDPEDLKFPETCNAAYIFCGRSRRKYPDSRPMGYPFDRLPYRVPEHKCGYGEKMNMKDLLCRLTGKIFTRPVATLEEFVSGVTNMAMTVVEIKHIPKVIGKHSG